MVRASLQTPERPLPADYGIAVTVCPPRTTPEPPLCSPDECRERLQSRTEGDRSCRGIGPSRCPHCPRPEPGELDLLRHQVRARWRYCSRLVQAAAVERFAHDCSGPPAAHACEAQGRIVAFPHLLPWTPGRGILAPRAAGISLRPRWVGPALLYQGVCDGQMLGASREVFAAGSSSPRSHYLIHVRLRRAFRRRGHYAEHSVSQLRSLG